MRGLDTNVLVRCIMQDDPVQAGRASRFIENDCTRESPGFVNRVVLCELVWVLESVYDIPSARIADVVEKILRIDRIKVEDLEAVWKALRSYRAGPADFADYLVGSVNHAAGCEITVTVDKACSRADGFKLLA